MSIEARLLPPPASELDVGTFGKAERRLVPFLLVLFVACAATGAAAPYPTYSNRSRISARAHAAARGRGPRRPRRCATEVSNLALDGMIAAAAYAGTLRP